MSEESKVLVLFSGGLDSTLAVKVMLEQGLDVEVAMFTTPFCLCDKCSAESIVKKFGLKAHKIFLGQDYLDLISNPPRGYGSQMNPCIDCRLLMMKKAKELANKIEAKCIVTGEVVGQRPFSQTKRALDFIEKKAGLEGKILRPLSAQLLKETEVERRGIVNREKLFSIQGRRRLPQMDLAKEWGIQEYPCPSGGCLLTDPRFADRLRDHLKHDQSLNIADIVPLRLGRHFRVDGLKIIVGRNKIENEKLLYLANNNKWISLEIVNYMGPITLIERTDDDRIIEIAAGITARYSDAEKGSEIKVKIIDGQIERIVRTNAKSDQEVKSYQI